MYVGRLMRRFSFVRWRLASPRRQGSDRDRPTGAGEALRRRLCLAETCDLGSFHLCRGEVFLLGIDFLLNRYC